MPKTANLRTTILQAFARTVLDDSRPQEASDAPGSQAADSLARLPTEGDIVGGLYKLVRVLGQGMFGKVYVAQRIDVPEHQVALKLLPRSLYVGRNVERELVMLATVGHPNVVQLKDHGTTDDYVWLTMPVYEGETLAERLERGPLDLRQAYDIFLPIARGLEALHAAGLRHQDIKPDNIYLAVFGGLVHPILLDLGVAAERDATFVAGTALYAAPEQVAALSGAPASLPLSEKMDTYGLATTLLVSLVGPDHFPGETARDRDELTAAHERRAREPIEKDALPDLTGRPRELLIEALRRFLALDPEARPTMRELAEELDVLLEPEREAQRREEQRRSQQKAALWRFKAVTGIILVAALGGAAVAYSKREMIRVANELQEARKRGAESFDKLDLCNASHRMAVGEASSCRAELGKARAELTELEKSFAEMSKGGTTSETEYARQLQSYATKLRQCEDGAAAAQKTCNEETTRILALSAREKDQLVAERDELKRLAEERQKKIAELEQAQSACDAERAKCVAARDSCQAAVMDPPLGGPAPKPPASASSTPAASATPVASTTAAPTSSPAPPPTNPAPPPVPTPPAIPATSAPH